MKRGKYGSCYYVLVILFFTLYGNWTRCCNGIGQGFNTRWKFVEIDSLITGVVGITIYAAFFSIFYKLSMAAHLSLLGIAVFCIYKNKAQWIEALRRLKKVIFSWEAVFYLCFIVLIAFFTSRGNFHTDSERAECR